MRGFLALIAIAVTGLGLYALPSLLELALVHGQLNPWISCVVLGDLFGCAILFLLGFRKMAVAIYVVSTSFEGMALWLRLLPPQRLVWVTNLIPAIVLGVILLKAALRNLVLEEN
jgi:hypothetical protein